MIPADDPNPFVAFRELLDSYRLALDAGWTDADFVTLVQDFDARVADVDGRGFEATPTTQFHELVPGATAWVKNETANVSGSHTARHLFGLALHLAVEADTESELGIASCGNAALGAAVVAAAIGRRLRVFIPESAEPTVVDRLDSLGALVTVCPRREGESGDPAYLRFKEAVEEGVRPFSCQGPDSPNTFDGGRTLGWELGWQLREAGATIDRIFIQVGGGAFATATMRGLGDAVRLGWMAARPKLHAVQTAHASPLHRAWQLFIEQAADGGIEDALAVARVHPDRFMWPWETEPKSIASGILDDVTYDWLPVVEAMADTGGWSVLADESQLARAYEQGGAITGIDAEPTGTAGLGGAFALVDSGENVAGENIGLVFSGVTRR